MSGLDLHTGLSDREAAERLRREGFNELPAPKPKSNLAIAAHVLREPMFVLLLATGVVYLALGSPKEAIALMGAIFVVIGITLYQERKTERTLQALRDLASPRALVIRNGQRKRISGREVVREDLLVLSEGDRVPADAFVPSIRDLFQFSTLHLNDIAVCMALTIASITGIEAAKLIRRHI